MTNQPRTSSTLDSYVRVMCEHVDIFWREGAWKYRYGGGVIIFSVLHKYEYSTHHDLGGLFLCCLATHLCTIAGRCLDL